MFWLILLVLATSATAQDEFGDLGDALQTLEGRLLVPRDIARKGAHVIMNGGERLAYLEGDGSFQIHGVIAGSHILDFKAADMLFSQVRIDMSKKKRGKIRASVSEAGVVETVPYPLLLEPKGKAQYFVPREEYNMMSILKNPMVMIMLAFGVMAFLLPKMADPEQMKEMREQMEELGMDQQQPSLSGLWNQLSEQPKEQPKEKGNSKKRQ
jgi:hypothetical protein